MKEQISNIKSLLSAFETRNELLHEEIKRNEKAMTEMQEELSTLLAKEEYDILGEETQLQMVF